ncbi:hypothetical protein ZWY2020_010950 [Hordeum vulgare]|nr:hypothetical protein ZWY2020_010950 [Hordeum vulgare]
MKLSSPPTNHHLPHILPQEKDLGGFGPAAPLVDEIEVEEQTSTSASLHHLHPIPHQPMMDSGPHCNPHASTQATKSAWPNCQGDSIDRGGSYNYMDARGLRWISNTVLVRCIGSQKHPWCTAGAWTPRRSSA